MVAHHLSRAFVYTFAHSRSRFHITNRIQAQTFVNSTVAKVRCPFSISVQVHLIMFHKATVRLCGILDDTDWCPYIIYFGSALTPLFRRRIRCATVNVAMCAVACKSRPHKRTFDTVCFGRAQKSREICTRRTGFTTARIHYIGEIPSWTGHARYSIGHIMANRAFFAISLSNFVLISTGTCGTVAILSCPPDRTVFTGCSILVFARWTFVAFGILIRRRRAVRGSRLTFCTHGGPRGVCYGRVGTCFAISLVALVLIITCWTRSARGLIAVISCWTDDTKIRG